jgi:HNH endonuclease
MNEDVKCNFCNIFFSAPTFQKRKFCSNKCYSSSKIRQPPKFNCLHCGKEFFDNKRNKNRRYCSRACIQKRDIQTWKPSYSCIRKRFEIRGKITACEKCGYSEHPEILGIHHLDENRKNNSLDNLIVVCANCHSLFHKKHIIHGSVLH